MGELSTTELPVMSRSCCRTTSPSRILLLSWVWTSCLRRTRSRSPGRGRSRGSCLSPSRSLRCLPTTLASLSPLPRPSGFKDILAGKYDHLPEGAFYMVGNVDEVVAKGERL